MRAIDRWRKSLKRRKELKQIERNVDATIDKYFPQLQGKDRAPLKAWLIDCELLDKQRRDAPRASFEEMQRLLHDPYTI